MHGNNPVPFHNSTSMEFFSSVTRLTGSHNFSERLFTVFSKHFSLFLYQISVMMMTPALPVEAFMDAIVCCAACAPSHLVGPHDPLVQRLKKRFLQNHQKLQQ